MNNDDPRWLQYLDDVTAWGREFADRPHMRPPTDPQLWQKARSRHGVDLPEQIDPALLDGLRQAFNLGYNGRISLQALADALQRRGYDAVVEHTGGNTATLYAGHQVPDRNGDLRWSVAAGPGWFEHPGRRRPFADTTEFAIGPNSDIGWTVTLPEPPTWTSPAELLIAVIDTVEAERTRFSRATEAAIDAMWATFAQNYPEITTGDVPPGADHLFLAEATKLLTGWLEDNWPTLPTVPPHIAALAAGDDTDR